MDVTYFRQRRPGPEAVIETAVATRLRELFPLSVDRPAWAAGSIPVGAGMPDLVLLTYEPEVLAISKADMPVAHVLAYLRSVGKARLDTIINRTGQPKKTIIRCLDTLVEARAVNSGCDVFAVSQTWRRILPDIVTIEAKVTDWRKALYQAGRNQIFAHRSFVALPSRIAERVASEPEFNATSIGLLAVNENHDVQALRDARRQQPRVWSYYYQLAAVVAKHLGKGRDAVYSTDTAGAGGIS